MVSLRQRNRLNAMRATQRVGLDLFIEHGFDAVSVAAVAAEAGLAASTIYRHFDTKEAIVLWDEHDADIDAALGRRLRSQPPLEAIRDGLIEALAGRYDADEGFQLRRVQFIYATEALHAAAVEADFRDRAELTAGVRHALSRKNKKAAPVIAGAALLALDVAIDEWQQRDGKRSLATCLATAFEQLATIGQLE